MKRIASVLLIILSISLLPAISATPPKAGVTCSKAGLSQVYQGMKFTCIKSGKKLIWDKGVATKIAAPAISPIPSAQPRSTPSPSPAVSPSVMPSSMPSPTPSPSPTPTPSQSPQSNSDSLKRVKQKLSLVTYSAPNLPTENIEFCKIKQPGVDGAKTGFPAPKPLYQSKGVVTWALIPIDFSDLPGEENFMSRASEQMKYASDWAENTSEGQFKIEWRAHNTWIRLPGSSKDYAIPVTDNKGFSSPAQQSVWLRAISESDKYFDFTGIQAVQFILPFGQSIIEYGIKGNNGFDVVRNYVTGEGTRIDLFSIPSTFNDEPNSGRNYWSWWMYHYMVGLGVAKYGGSKVATPLHTYLIQGSTEGARELGGWMRFLVGWMPESRVYCRTAANLSKVEVTLIPLTVNSTQGIKLAVFPLSDSKALILESRRETKFACTTNTERNGVLAYIYDSALGHEDEYFKAISPSGRPTESYSCYASPTTDFLLHEGDKVTYEGLTVEMVLHGDFDQVRVTRNA